jgi:hypothetical protein
MTLEQLGVTAGKQVKAPGGSSPDPAADRRLQHPDSPGAGGAGQDPSDDGDVLVISIQVTVSGKAASRLPGASIRSRSSGPPGSMVIRTSATAATAGPGPPQRAPHAVTASWSSSRKSPAVTS